MLYIIKDAKSKAYKIGVTANLSKRFHDLQTGNPNKLELLWVLKVNQISECYALEFQLHYHLKELRTREYGEWFYLSSQILGNIVKDLSTLTVRYRLRGIEAELLKGEDFWESVKSKTAPVNLNIKVGSNRSEVTKVVACVRGLISKNPKTMVSYSNVAAASGVEEYQVKRIVRSSGVIKELLEHNKGLEK